MQRVSSIPLTILLGLTLAIPACFADDIAVVPGSNGFQNDAWNGNVTIGWQFTLSAPVTVTELGFFDANGSEGLFDSHPVGIWSASGTLLGSATVPAGSVGTLDGFSFVAVTPFTLDAGMYTIGSYGNEDSPDQFQFGLSGSTAIPGLAIGNGVQSAFGPTTLTLPSQVNDFAAQGYFGPDFMVGAATATPEPGTLMLLGSFLGLGGLLRRRKQ